MSYLPLYSYIFPSEKPNATFIPKRKEVSEHDPEKN